MIYCKSRLPSRQDENVHDVIGFWPTSIAACNVRLYVFWNCVKSFCEKYVGVVSYTAWPREGLARRKKGLICLLVNIK